jgi:restriction endonuclease Mrr
MTPEQLEQYIADLFDTKGYETKITPKSYDFGVDVIATNSDEKIAIQVKMYETRPVNYKDIMYLYAGKEYYDCDKGLLITTCSCDPLAIKVADKLGIEIQENFVAKKIQAPNKTKTVSTSDTDFEEVWQKFIKPLQGQM